MHILGLSAIFVAKFMFQKETGTFMPTPFILKFEYRTFICWRQTDTSTVRWLYFITAQQGQLGVMFKS